MFRTYHQIAKRPFCTRLCIKQSSLTLFMFTKVVPAAAPPVAAEVEDEETGLWVGFFCSESRFLTSYFKLGGVFHIIIEPS